MSRRLATVELIEDDDGNVTAEVDYRAELSAMVRREAVDAVAAALSPEALSPEEWEQSWSSEIAERTRAIDEGRTTMVSEDEAVMRMFRRASAATR